MLSFLLFVSVTICFLKNDYWHYLVDYIDNNIAKSYYRLYMHIGLVTTIAPIISLSGDTVV